jgi:uncharacterized protein (TIGR04255 family)
VKLNSDDLPEFDAPPLNEVVLGIQFHPAANYQQVRAFEVWELFRDKFPVVQDQQALPPTFETFGLPQNPQFNFGMITGASHDRYWFLTKTGDELIQFQQDRLLHNWRKIGDQTNEYPRFEKIVVQFQREIALLEAYFKGLGNDRLMVNQCEVSYINNIGFDDPTSIVLPQHWLAYVSESHPATDEFFYVSRRVLFDDGGKPIGRLHRESATTVDRLGRKILTLTLTVRGRPSAETPEAAIEFITKARRLIAQEFIAMTTQTAQQIWKRTR